MKMLPAEAGTPTTARFGAKGSLTLNQEGEGTKGDQIEIKIRMTIKIKRGEADSS